MMQIRHSAKAPRQSRRTASIAIPLCTVLALGMAGSASAATDWQTVADKALLPQTAALHDLGALTAGAPVHVVLSLRMRHADELQDLTREQATAGSPSYQRYLSAADFNARFAPDQARVDSVTTYLQHHGFVNVDVAENRLLISADGSAASARSAFNTALDQFSLAGERMIANTRPIQLPAALMPTVNAVLGLQTVNRFHTTLQAAAVNTAKSSTARPQAEQAAHGFAPTDFPKAYGVGDTPNAGNTTVGIVTAGDISQTFLDLAQAQKMYGLPSIPTETVPVGPAGTDTDGVPEWDLDSQDIQAMAGGVVQNMIFYNTTSLSNADITAAYNAALNDNRAKLVNVSLGECERSAQSDMTSSADDQIFVAAIAQGMTFSVSSGDSGSHECMVSLPLRRGARQSYPASSPYVVSVGGTSLYVDGNGGYARESAWNKGGGGPSTIEAQPSYQNGIVPGSARGVPDIALDADPNTGSIIIANGATAQYGGTSLASPLFVGLYARILSATGNSHGFPNPSLYQSIPSNPSLVHDVTTGSNGGINAYAASRGWDYTTGFGSPIVAALYHYVEAHPNF